VPEDDLGCGIRVTAHTYTILPNAPPRRQVVRKISALLAVTRKPKF